MFRLLPIWMLSATAFAWTRQYRLELTWRQGAPDGFQREMIFINGQFPGPTIEANEGDWVEVQVVNNMPFNTTIHYHGIEQRNTPWSDGVPGLSQRPIQPGASYNYKWHAGQYGSYFYHSHSQSQIEDGCYGPIIIHPQQGKPNPFAKINSAEVDQLRDAEANVHPIILSDWYHQTSQVLIDETIASGIELLCLDSLLVNGKGAVDCWSRQDINAYTPQPLPAILGAHNLSLTDKGCLPPAAYTIIDPPYKGFNESVLPPSVYDICKSTQGSMEVIQAPRGKKWLALDLISSHSNSVPTFSIDEHPMWVYAVDGHYIEPIQVDAITLQIGERFSVFIELDKPSGNYGIRVSASSIIQLIDTTAILSYGGGYGVDGNNQNISSTPYTNRVGAPTSSNVTFFSQAQQVSFPPAYPTTEPEIAQTLVLSLEEDFKVHPYVWALNATPFDGSTIYNSNPPLLYQTPSVKSFDQTTAIVTKNNTWIDLILQVTQLGEPAHPIHKHSNKAFIIGGAKGTFTWATVADAAKAMPQAFNFVSPPYVDIFPSPGTTSQPAWIAVRYHVENPGAFLLHCHIQSHLEFGMAMVILDGADEWPQVPGQYRN